MQALSTILTEVLTRRAPSRRPQGLPSTCDCSVSLRFQFGLSQLTSACSAWSWRQRWSSVIDTTPFPTTFIQADAASFR
jgi:hypothetical protein